MDSFSSIDNIYNSMHNYGINRLDMQGAPLKLNYNSIETYRSRTGGIISLCYILIAIFIISFKITEVIAKQNITVTQNIIKEANRDPLILNNSDFRMQFAKFVPTVADSLIKFADQGKYGIKVNLTEYTNYLKNGKIYFTFQQYETVQCPGNQHGFCVPPHVLIKVLGKTDILIRNKTDGEVYRRYSFRVNKCSTETDPNCEEFKQELAPFFYFNSTVINPNALKQEDTLQYRGLGRGFQNNSPVSLHNNIEFTFYFQNITIITDPSISPLAFDDIVPFRSQKNQQEIWYYDEQMQKQISPDAKDNLPLLEIFIKRSEYNIVYERRYTKIDEALGEIFGLLGLFSIILFCLYKGYNQWSFEQFRLEAIGQQRMTPTLCNYYRYLIKKYFCRQNNQKTDQKLKNHVDILILSQKIDKIQKLLKLNSQTNSSLPINTQSNFLLNRQVSQNSHLTSQLLQN